jgi:hypothetical protein
MQSLSDHLLGVCRCRRRFGWVAGRRGGPCTIDSATPVKSTNSAPISIAGERDPRKQEGDVGGSMPRRSGGVQQAEGLCLLTVPYGWHDLVMRWAAWSVVLGPATLVVVSAVVLLLQPVLTWWSVLDLFTVIAAGMASGTLLHLRVPYVVGRVLGVRCVADR